LEKNKTDYHADRFFDIFRDLQGRSKADFRFLSNHSKGFLLGDYFFGENWSVNCNCLVQQLLFSRGIY